MDESGSGLAGVPPASPLEDPPLRFYLKHRERIREWSALEQRVVAATHSVLLEVASDLWDITSSLGSDVIVNKNAKRGGAFDRIALMRSSWPLVSGEAVVAVTLEWGPSVDPAREGLAPAIGIRVDPAFEVGKRVQAIAQSELAGSPVVRSRQYELRPNNGWPVMRRKETDPDWWQDVRGWRGRLVAGMVETWQLTIAYLDRTISDQL